jgi:preprotein translocase subunit SecD
VQVVQSRGFVDSLCPANSRSRTIGSRLVAETIIGLVVHDPHSYLNQAGGWTPAKGVRLANGDPIVTIRDFLRFGGLPVELEQSEVRAISATLGRDSLNAGVKAGILGLTGLLVYMFLYYRALGLVVGLGLLLFTAAMYALLALLGETAGLALTLAGVAGFIVAIGVTADSYIVAFERLKDEIRAGKSMRAAVERGTGRAVRTMLIADFVTGAAAVILFLLAVGPVRGFALVLGLATAIDVLLIWFFIRPSIVLMSRSRFFMENPVVGLRRAIGTATPATAAAATGGDKR